MAKDQQAQEQAQGEAQAVEAPKERKPDGTYRIFTTDEHGILTPVGQETAPTAERARRAGAKKLLTEEGQSVEVVAVAVKALASEKFGIVRPEPRLTAVS